MNRHRSKTPKLVNIIITGTRYCKGVTIPGNEGTVTDREKFLNFKKRHVFWRQRRFSQSTKPDLAAGLICD